MQFTYHLIMRVYSDASTLLIFLVKFYFHLGIRQLFAFCPTSDLSVKILSTLIYLQSGTGDIEMCGYFVQPTLPKNLDPFFLSISISFAQSFVNLLCNSLERKNKQLKLPRVIPYKYNYPSSSRLYLKIVCFVIFP